MVIFAQSTIKVESELSAGIHFVFFMDGNLEDVK